ncbi:MAG: NAD(P)H-dependent glycerol-3-phosphate dehydrogenase [Candidatus Omnitrophota bacterium]
MKTKSSKNYRIGILGDGGWGTTLAILLSKKGFDITLWGAFKNYTEELKKKRINAKFLPGIKIPKSIKITSNLSGVVTVVDIIVLAVPSQFIRRTVKRLRIFDLKNKIILSVAKGIENNTLMLVSDIIKDELGANLKLAVLSGPTIAHEVAVGIPTTAVIASKNLTLAKELQNIFNTSRFRIYINSDIRGVELGGAVKNVIAIACGISDGLSFGTNTKAAILTRGLVEIKRLGKAMGAKPETFNGISGLGDLVTTCASIYSRNRYVGEQIGKGKTIKEILKNMQMIAEGILTTKSVYQLARKYKVDMPITNQVYSVLYKNKNPLKAVNDLMTRRRKEEGK